MFYTVLLSEIMILVDLKNVDSWNLAYLYVCKHIMKTVCIVYTFYHVYSIQFLFAM